MAFEGRDRISDVYHAALKRAPEARVAFLNDACGGDEALRVLLWKPADGTGTEERLATEDFKVLPASWSRTGELGVMRHQPATDFDIWVVPLAGDREPRAIVQTKAREIHPDFSPDGRWLAFTSNESGRDEVHVQPFPGPGPRQQVSGDGGIAPAWSRDSHELFFQTRRPGTVEGREIRPFMAVPVGTNERFGLPKVLFERPYPKTELPIREYDVTPDGWRFLLLHEERPPITVTEMILVQNWVEELKRRVPTRSRNLPAARPTRRSATPGRESA